MMVAGKANDPIPMQFTEIMCKTKGQEIALDWLSHQQQYEGWTLKPPIQCVRGKYESSHRA